LTADRPPAAPAAAPKVVLAEGIHKQFGSPPLGSEILRGAGLQVAAGELVALVGRSGSGKSTLLHILGGLDRDYRGRAELFGQRLDRLSDHALSQLRSRQVGFVFQSFHLLEHLSCLDNVQLPNAFADQPLPKQTASDQARDALSRVGLSGRESAKPSQLSGGQRQRVAIARALFFRPQLLLCDEPTGNLDVETGQRIIELFAELNRSGLTLLLVTHEPRVAAVATRLLRIEDGLAQPVAGSALTALAPAAASTEAR
jgi:putative ABC transport system ATP-binding protein